MFWGRTPSYNKCSYEEVLRCWFEETFASDNCAGLSPRGRVTAVPTALPRTSPGLRSLMELLDLQGKGQWDVTPEGDTASC